MSWITWRQYRVEGAWATAFVGALTVVLIVSGLHAANVWHAALTNCARGGVCGGLAGSGLTLNSPTIEAIVVATSAVPLLPGLFWGAPMVARELETGTNQFAWTQSITRRRWFVVRTAWLLLAAAVVAGVVAVVVTWWFGPEHALQADAFQANRFDITDVVPVAYAIFAMALGICAGTVLRRTLGALAVTLAGFVGVRAFVSQWLRLHYLTPLTVQYKLSSPFVPSGSYLGISQGILGPNGQVPALGYNVPSYNGVPLPAACRSVPNPLPCLATHGYRGFLTYQPADRFWTFQGIETGIFLVLAAGLLGLAYFLLERRDA
jgi:hypothetical protein